MLQGVQTESNDGRSLVRRSPPYAADAAFEAKRVVVRVAMKIGKAAGEGGHGWLPDWEAGSVASD